MTEFKCNVSEPWFSFICSGTKKIEGRLRKGIFNEIKENDVITFTNNEKSIKTKVTKINYFESFQEYLEKENLEICLPGIQNIEEGVNIYHKYYSEKKEKQYKVFSIHFII